MRKFEKWLSDAYRAIRRIGGRIAGRFSSVMSAGVAAVFVVFLLVPWMTLGDGIDGSAMEVDFRTVQLPGGVGFDLSQAAIAADEIRAGGPHKDGIPALVDPKMIAAHRVDFLKDFDRVIGVRIGDLSRAYPFSILNYHEIVNDTIQDIPIAVTYCPLCDSAVVFDRRTPDGERRFGVSGLLYNSNVLMYDRSERESLWSQMKGEAISGPAVGTRLAVLPHQLVSWGNWRKRYPETEVLSDQTGHRRDYRSNPYEAYFRHGSLMFPAKPMDPRLAAKTAVIGVWDDTHATAFPISEFGDRSTESRHRLNGKSFTIVFDPIDRSVRVTDADVGLSAIHSFWFAWYAFRPHTSLFEP